MTSQKPATGWWSRGYAEANGTVSTFGGHRTKEAAIADAESCLRSRRVRSAWIRNPEWEVVWRQTKDRIKDGLDPWEGTERDDAAW
jgi:hypothetical protein